MDFKYFPLLQLWLGLLISQVLLDGSFGVVYLLALRLASAYQHQQEKRKRPLWLSYFRRLLLCCLVSSVQLLSQVRLFATPWTAACQASLSTTNSWSLLKLISIELVMPSNHLTPVIHFSCLQSCPAPGSFPVSQFFTSDGQGIGASTTASVLSMNIQNWFPLGLTGLIFLLFKGLSGVFSHITVQEHQFFGTQLSLWSNSRIHTWLPEKS